MNVELTDDPHSDHFENDSKVWEYIFDELYSNEDFKALSALYAFRLNGARLEYQEQTQDVAFTAKTVKEENLDGVDEDERQYVMTKKEYNAYINDIIKPLRDKIRPILNQVAEKSARKKVMKEGA